MWDAVWAAVFCVITWLAFKLKEVNPLDHLPGPPRHPLIGNALQLMKIKPDDLFKTMLEYKEQFGDRFIFKIPGTYVLHITTPSDMETVLCHTRNITKSNPYTFLQPWLGTGLLLSTGSKWHRRRKILTPTFHFNILKRFYVVIEENGRALVEKLKSTRGTEVDLLPVLSDFTLFTICETAMGTQLDTDKSSATLQYKNAILNIGSLLISRITRIWLHNDFIFKMSTIGRKFEKSLTTVRSFADNVIKERKEKRMQDEEKIVSSSEDSGKKRLAMLDLLIEAEEKGEIDLEGIREEVNTFMFEGHDTTAMGLTFCIMLLADHEEIQERVYEECQLLFDKCGGSPSMSDFSETKYLEAVIKESLRLYPSVPFIGRETDEDFILGDLLVKKGTELSIHLYDLHHRADLFPDPEAFRPERFLGGEERHPYAFVPFSAGPRNCIGQRFAMVEMKCALSEICRHFRLEPHARGWRPQLKADMVLRPTEPIYVKFIPRV